MKRPSYRFDSRVEDLGPFEGAWAEEQIKNEPMFFNASCMFAAKNGGLITTSFLNAVPTAWLVDSVIDTRVHMLMPGWYPAIPGYHHDDVPRLGFGQPDYDTPEYRSEHLTGLVNGELAPTEFALGECELPGVPDGGIVYRAWHFEVERLLRAKKLELWKMPSGRLIGFDWQTFHTAARATGTGWRWFARISRKTNRVKHITNEIRRQVQVYMEAPMEGW